MTLNDFLSSLTRLVYALVGFVTLAQWLRTRDRTRLDIALVFVSLGLTLIIQSAEAIFGAQIQWLETLGTLALLAHPYFLLRIAHYFRPVPRPVRIGALLGLAVSWAALLLSDAALSTPLTLVIVLYFASVEAYATSIFIRGALITAGITRQRLRLASVGSGLLAGIILLAGVLTLLPVEFAELISPLFQVFALLAGLSYYLGFSPPRWLRQNWQLNELHDYLRETSGQWAQKSSNTFKYLTTSAIRATGGTAAAIAAWDFEHKTLRIDTPGWNARQLHTEPGAISMAWRERKARLADVRKDIGPGAEDWATQAGAESVLIVPIVSPSRAWGLLIVALRHSPLFVEDDLELLTLLAGQSAIVLDHGALLEELKTANQSLEQRVSERTLELEKINQELQSSEERYRNTLDTMLEGAQIIGFDWRYLYVNEMAAEQGRQSKENLLGRTMMEMYPGIENTEAFVVFERCMKDRVPQQMENEFIYPDGSKGWFELNIHPVPEGIFILSMDISERKRAQQVLEKAGEELEQLVKERTAALSEANALLQTMMDNMPDHIYFKDSDSRFIRNSRSQAKMMGYDPADVVGKTDFDFFQGEHAQRSFDEEQKVIKSGQPLVNIEERVVWPDGRVTWVSTTKLPLRDAKDQVTGTFGISRDITERKQAEEALEKSNVQLEAANRELESFSYSVSHDLRAPLRSIDGFSQALLEDYGDKIPQEGRNYLERARAAAQRMAELIDDILALSRVSRAPVQRGTVDLSALAQGILSDLQNSDPDRRVSMVITPNMLVEGDQNLLRIALQNLLANAWKFTSKKADARIEFDVQNESGERTFLIRDNGSGFDMNYANKLFGAFQRLHSADEFPGTGIGLATVQRVFHKHGGRVWAEGVVDQGATFYFTV
jgi:PAS domain S-box-containing protein